MSDDDILIEAEKEQALIEEMQEEPEYELPEFPEDEPETAEDAPQGDVSFPNVEHAIKVPPDALAYRLDEQERDDILTHEELRELAKSAITIGILCLIAVVI